MTRRSDIATGVLAATAAIATSEGLSAILNLRESPVLAVGQTVIKLTPGPIAEKIISIVQHADKPLAVTSVVIAILLLGGLIQVRGGSAVVRSRSLVSPSSSCWRQPRCWAGRMVL